MNRKEQRDFLLELPDIARDLLTMTSPRRKLIKGESELDESTFNQIERNYLGYINSILLNENSEPEEELLAVHLLEEVFSMYLIYDEFECKFKSDFLILLDCIINDERGRNFQILDLSIFNAVKGMKI